MNVNHHDIESNLFHTNESDLYGTRFEQLTFCFRLQIFSHKQLSSYGFFFVIVANFVRI